MRRICLGLVVARLSFAWVPPAPSRPSPRRATENDDKDEDSSPLAWLRSKRDTFEPKWSWLKDRRDFSDVVRAGRHAEREQLVRGQRAIKESISRLAAPGAAGELLDFLEGEVRKERAVRNATLIFIKDEWAREEALRRETRAREEALRESALRFVDDEWAREDELRRDARAFVVRGSARIKFGLHAIDATRDGVAMLHPTHRLTCAQADEFERLADADEELAARIRGAPQITVCAAPIACGKADGQLVHDRLARLAAGEALAGRPAPLVRCVLARARITFHLSIDVYDRHKMSTRPVDSHAGDEVRLELPRGQGRRHARRAAPRGRLLRRGRGRRVRGRARLLRPRRRRGRAR